MPRIRKNDSPASAGNGKKRSSTGITAVADKVHTIPSAQLEDEIRQRAYELYEERGRQEGFEYDDWLRAEQEVLSRRGIRRSA